MKFCFRFIRLAILFCVSTAPLLSTSIIEDRQTVEILSPSFKDQKTIKLKLDNGLKVYIISDPKVDKSSAALAVNTGSWEEPNEFPGLAHFLEHMLFLGTKKYPIESEYHRFIQANGGRPNAFTSSLYTSYMFDIDTSAFPEALDRFSQFFKEPLFNRSGVDREMHAVHNEFSGLIEKNNVRRVLVAQELSNPKHPDHRFTVGNLTSLQGVNTDDLRKWFETHYSSNLMTLILYSPLPLETLETLAIEFFSDIPNQNRTPMYVDEPVISSSMKGKITYIAPIEEQNLLTLFWQLPKEIVNARDSKPEEVVCYLLGHEGVDSLLAELRRLGLATKLSCGTDRESHEQMFLAIQIELTTEGVKRLFEVIQTVFEAIESYKEQGIAKYLFDDIHDMQVLKYQYPSRDDAFEEVFTHVIKLQFEDLTTYPESVEIIQSFNPSLVKKVLQSLTPDNAYMDFIVSPELSKVKFDRKEKWMNIPYTVQQVPKKVFQQWKQAKPNPKIAIPQSNPWIPRSQVSIETEYKKEFPKPALMIDNEIGRLYVATDQIYLIPESSLWLLIKTPKLKPGDALQATLTELHLKIIEEAMKSINYDALNAGLEFKLERTEEGIVIRIDGYSENIHKLIEEIALHLKKTDPSLKDFLMTKECLLREYQNAAKKNPFHLAIQEWRNIFYDHYVTDIEKLEAIEQLTYEEFLSSIDHLYDQTYIQGLIYGNLDANQASQIWNQFIATLNTSPYPEGKKEQTQVLVLPENKGPFLIEKTVKNRGNALLLAIEQFPFTFQKYAAQEILSKYLGQEFFNELRTKQQTGYLVAQASNETYSMLVNVFGIESHSHLARDLLSRAELFLEQQVEFLRSGQFTEDEFEIIRQALINELESPPENMKEMGKELYSLIIRHEADFSWRQKRLNGIKTLQYNTFLQLSEELLSRENRRRLAILVRGSIPSKEDFNFVKVKGAEWFHEHVQYE